MKRLRIPPGNAPTNSVPRTRVIKLANMVEVCRDHPSDGGQDRGPAGKGGMINWPFQGVRLTLESSLPSWAEGATRCLNAYIKRDYSVCVAAGAEVLSHEFIPTVGLVTILALRRRGQSKDADPAHLGGQAGR